MLACDERSLERRFQFNRRVFVARPQRLLMHSAAMFDATPVDFPTSIDAHADIIPENCRGNVEATSILHRVVKGCCLRSTRINIGDYVFGVTVAGMDCHNPKSGASANSATFAILVFNNLCLLTPALLA
jgi:hypothetical protein